MPNPSPRDRPSPTTDYVALLDTPDPQQQEQVSLLNPLRSPFREEASVHNDASERILFADEDEEILTLPSHDYASPRTPYDNDDDDDDFDGVGLGNRRRTRSASSLSTTSRSRRRLQSDHNRPRCNGLNYLNVVTYVAHLFVSWGIGVWGLDGILKTRWEISLEYETLCTTASWTYWTMWYTIYVLEGVFAVCQLLPYYRARPIVQAGTGYYFFYTFLVQTAWTLFYSFQLFICSFIAVVVALLALIKLLLNQRASINDGTTMSTTVSLSGQRFHQRRIGGLEYYFFRLPFHVHMGWLAVIVAHHFTLLFRRFNAPVSLQVAVDIVALGSLLPVAVVFLVNKSYGKDFVVPLVILLSYVSPILLLGVEHVGGHE